MATKVQFLVVAVLALTVFAINDSQDQKKKKMIAIDPLTAKDAASAFEDALSDEEPLIKEEEKDAKPSPMNSLVKTIAAMSKKASPAMPGVPTQNEGGEWANDFEGDVSKLVLGLSAGSLAATPFGNSIQQISELINDRMKPQVITFHEEDVAEMTHLAEVVEECETTRGNSMSPWDEKRIEYEAKSAEHKSCRATENEYYNRIEPCNEEWRNKRAVKIDKCTHYESEKAKYGETVNNQAIMEQATGEEVESYLTRVTATICGSCAVDANGYHTGGVEGAAAALAEGHSAKAWHGMWLNVTTARIECTTAMDELKNKGEECKDNDHQWAKKQSECDVTQGQMEELACEWATGYKETCASYNTCFTRDHETYSARKEAIEQRETDRKAEWKGLSRMGCLIDAFATPSDSPSVTPEEIEWCRNQTYNVSHLDVPYPDEGNSGSAITYPQSHCSYTQLYPSTPEWKTAEFGDLPENAKGRSDSYVCPGLTEVSLETEAVAGKNCSCEHVTLEGSFSPGDLILCTNCLDVYKSNDKNSCPVGTKIWSPRTASDWESWLLGVSEEARLLAQKPNFLVDVTRATNAAPNPAVNSATTSGNSQPMAKRWMTSDGSPWWLRPSAPEDSPYAAATTADNYEANCFMNLVTIPAANLSTTGVTFDTASSSGPSCEYHSDSYYCQPREENLQPAAGSGDACTCKKVQLVGTYSAGVLLKCEKCLDIHQSTDQNSCPEGTKLFAPESEQDWTTFLASAAPLRAPHWIVDITRPQDGCGGCDQFAMNSAQAEQATWVTKDGAPWFLRSAAIGQPMVESGGSLTSETTFGGNPQVNGYKANCYLNLYSFATAESIVWESEGTAEGTHSPIRSEPETSTHTCEFHSTSYYCQSVRTTTTTTTPATCHSLYTGAMCPSGHLVDNFDTVRCTSNPCEDGDADDALCCKPKAKCNSIPYAASWCPSGALAANQDQLECTGSACEDNDADDAICCQPPTCATYNCTTEGWVKISGSNATEQGPTPETACCEEAVTYTYTRLENKNCYQGGGASYTGGDYDPGDPRGDTAPAGHAVGGLTADECQARCSEQPECSCVVFGGGMCWRRQGCDATGETMSTQNGYDVYVKNEAS